VTSEGAGCGSEFTVLLPVARHPKFTDTRSSH